MTQTKRDEHPHQSFWLWVMCLTGVDYFSTLGYQPSIAFNATGLLAPFATVVLVCVTLFCALPVYRYVAGESPHGQGSIAMLEGLLHGWASKFLVLVLLGFAATDFVITKTLSAADAAEHLLHNPMWSTFPPWLHNRMLLAMFLLVLLGTVFLRGFREVIAVAVVVVSVYLVLNALVILAGFVCLAHHPDLVSHWLSEVAQGNWHMEGGWPVNHNFGMLVLACFLYFPKLALGLSGFETGVAVMPLIRGDDQDDPHRPAGRIAHTRKLLLTAAVIMSCMLLGSAVVTCTLIPPEALLSGGKAANRALAFLAHGDSPVPLGWPFGGTFGTVYDVTTVVILWFAGASAMSGLLNLVPRYLPRYGMAPRWAEAFRPLVVLFTCVGLLVTWVFDASVEQQGGAYATGVMVLISSACVAVVIDEWRKRGKQLAESVTHTAQIETWAFRLRRVPWRYVLISGVFFYTTVAIVIEKPHGIQIAGAFIVSVIVVSLVSRMRRSTEIRFEKFEFVDETSRMLWDTLRFLEFPVLVPHRPGHRSVIAKDERIRRIHRLSADVPIVFIEATLGDPSQFEQSPQMEVTQESGRFVIRVNHCASVAHAIASIALELSKTGKPPEVHFGWSDQSALAANLSFVFLGEGNIPWLVRELIGKAESDPEKRPRVVIG